MYQHLRRIEAMLILHDLLDIRQFPLLIPVQLRETLSMSFPDLWRMLWSACDVFAHIEKKWNVRR